MTGPAAVSSLGTSHLADAEVTRTLCGVRVTPATGWSRRPEGVLYVTCDRCRKAGAL